MYRKEEGNFRIDNWRQMIERNKSFTDSSTMKKKQKQNESYSRSACFLLCGLDEFIYEAEANLGGVRAAEYIVT